MSEFCQYVVPDIVIIIRGHLLLNMRMELETTLDKSATIICLKGPFSGSCFVCMICVNKIEWLHFEQYPDKLPSIFLVFEEKETIAQCFRMHL